MLSKYKLFVTALFLFFPFFLFSQQAKVISYDTQIAFENGKLKKTVDVALQINDKRAVDLGEIEIPYNSSMRINRAYILDAQGQLVKKLKGKDINTKSLTENATFYSDANIKYFTLKWSSFPYSIHYSYTTSVDNFISITHWIPFIYKNINTESATLEVVLPKDYEYKVYEQKGGFIKHEKKTDEHVILSWELDPMLSVKIREERFSAHIQDLLPMVLITPKSFKYGEIGDLSTWNSYGDWVYSLSEGMDELTTSEKEKVHALTDHISTKEEKVKVLYNYLQENTRYINVSVDIGGLVPYPASYVCENKYGDCKALTNYMKALLKEVGIPSYAVDVKAGKKVKKIIHDFPSQQFNHVILGVPLENDTLFLENTSKYLPYNYLGDFTYGREALWIEKGNSRLITLPKYTTQTAKEELDLQYTFNEDLSAKIDIQWTVRGAHFSNILHVKNLTKEEDKINYFKNVGLTYNINVETIEFEENNKSDEIKVHIKGSSNKIIRKVGTLFVISPTSFFDTKLEGVDERINDIVIHHPTHQQITVSYDLGSLSDRYVELSPEKIIRSKYGSFAITYENLKDKHLVKMHQTYLLPSATYPKEEYQDFYDFIKDIERIMKDSNIILKRTI
ncbi:DUF3857 domain-containing transglutaminase family protein [Flammeovirga pacifica]|uniref:DUF3857 domain-containing protein n=1 Tax=Flammeovirga pacifica TaxID=915059 RepID=A0A1S1YUZ9_FLAPC|nr:DUF3857 and transglutaminase domain-containing protein [Flammeovirga pacifica]OHX64854.1 hypothetical protein NH26_00105 [Flammeovirga pacifica]